MFNCLSFLRANARRAAVTTFAAAFITSSGRAQADSAVRDSTRHIERVLITAIRAERVAPITQSTITHQTIAKRQFGQDVPLLLQGAVPSLTAHTETGTNWGYSYLRLRGMDQTRVNITIDGVPLNDMEDQVLYFANFADLMSSVQSVQVQRGVGTSSAGTASFAGSINFETTPIFTQKPAGEVTVQVGSFGSQRVSGSFHSGLQNNVAAYGRFGVVKTDGYRDHSGVRGGSALLGAGWFGTHDIVKATALAGRLMDTLSYVGATLAELATNRRYNPLSPNEQDAFSQQMLALTHTHMGNGGTSVSTTLYRNSAQGNYDYFDSADRYSFYLGHWWYGLTSAASAQRGSWQWTLGANANTYARDHRGTLKPATQLYENTGYKRDVSGFAKVARTAGRAVWFVDVQGRRAEFRYKPDAAAGIAQREHSWDFVNPKLGVSYAANAAVRLYASFGRTSREPARNDLFAGEDDLNAGNVGDYGNLARIKPESVNDFEGGVEWKGKQSTVSGNVYAMEFRNDIARIGAPTASGAIVRRNVGASYRRGFEVDWSWDAWPALTLGGNAAFSTNRIRQFVDSSGASPVRRENVQPLLTPRAMLAQRADWHPTSWAALGVEGRWQGESYLDNTANPARRLPSSVVTDASLRVTRDAFTVTVRGSNLNNSARYGSGSVSGSGTVRYFVLAPRSIFVTASVALNPL